MHIEDCILHIVYCILCIVHCIVLYCIVFYCTVCIHVLYVYVYTCIICLCIYVYVHIISQPYVSKVREGCRTISKPRELNSFSHQNIGPRYQKCCT